MTDWWEDLSIGNMVLVDGGGGGKEVFDLHCLPISLDQRFILATMLPCHAIVFMTYLAYSNHTMV